MPGRRVLIAALFAALLGAVQADDALACTCAPRTPGESVAAADAAIVGRLLAIEPRGPGRAEYRYRVVRVYRGDGQIRRRAAIAVLSGRGSAGCALPTRTGRDYGLLLRGENGRWAGGICGVLAPRRLWWAVRQAPARSRAAGAPSCAS